MSISYYIRVLNLGPKNADYDNALLDSVEIPGSYYTWQMMEHQGYKVSTPEEGSCGDVVTPQTLTTPLHHEEVRYLQNESLARHQRLFEYFGRIRADGRCEATGIQVAGDEDAVYRVNKMVDALHTCLQVQKAMLAIGAPVLVTISWS